MKGERVKGAGPGERYRLGVENVSVPDEDPIHDYVTDPPILLILISCLVCTHIPGFG
jgi:hypothetical protein